MLLQLTKHKAVLVLLQIWRSLQPKSTPETEDDTDRTSGPTRAIHGFHCLVQNPIINVCDLSTLQHMDHR